MISQSDLQNLEDMYGSEALKPELSSYISASRFGEVLHHPLMIHVMYTPHMNKLINRQYEQKTKALNEAISEENWSQFIFLHERPYRIDALQKVLFDHDVKSPEVWGLIGRVWIDSENIWENEKIWRQIWDIDIPDRIDHLMSDAERSAFEALPSEITVYRGHTYANRSRGMSWSLDRDKAIWFAQRFAGAEKKTPKLSTGIVSKDDILAVFLGRNESEIVSHKVRNIRSETI